MAQSVQHKLVNLVILTGPYCFVSIQFVTFVLQCVKMGV